MQNLAGNLRDALLELLAPTRCAGCEAPGTLLCDACRASLPRIDPETRCGRCGAPQHGESCRECASYRFSFQSARCLGSLAHPLSRLVSLHKDGGEVRLASVLAGFLGEVAGEWLDWADVVVPVPASPAGVRRRNRDHMLDVAALLAEENSLPLAAVLSRVAGHDQRGLGRADRERNVRAGMCVQAGDAVFEDARVLLVDDVLTTGATVEAASRLLLSAGARRVRVACVARAHG